MRFEGEEVPERRYFCSAWYLMKEVIAFRPNKFYCTTGSVARLLVFAIIHHLDGQILSGDH